MSCSVLRVHRVRCPYTCQCQCESDARLRMALQQRQQALILALNAVSRCLASLNNAKRCQTNIKQILQRCKADFDYLWLSFITSEHFRMAMAGLWHVSQSFGLLARPQGWNRKSQIWAEYLSYVCVRLSIVGSRKLSQKHPIATYKSIIYAWFCKTDATLAWCSWRMWQVASLCNQCKPASTMWPRWRRSLRLSCKPSNRPVLKAECYVLGTLRQR